MNASLTSTSDALEARDAEEERSEDLSDAHITLGLLTAIEGSVDLTQRSVAKELGIALGLANAYLKRCVKKGYVKVRQVPKNRYAYYLTPKGFAEKGRLTADYLTRSFRFFRAARFQCEDAFQTCVDRGWRRIVLVGASDFGEIALHCVREYPLMVVAVFDIELSQPTFHGLPVNSDKMVLANCDAAIVTSLSSPQDAYLAAASVLPADRIFAPELLNISRKPHYLAED